MVAFGVIEFILISCFYGAILALVLGAVLAVAARILVPKGAPGRPAFLWVCFRRPFLLIPWMLLMLIVYSLANGIIFHRDNGLGVNDHAPLPNGYLLGYVNYNCGFMLTPESAFGSFPSLADGTINGVTGMDVAGDYILGSKHLPPPNECSGDKEFFLLDTRTKSAEILATLDELRNASSQKGIQVALEDPLKVYSRYRRTWFDGFLPVALALGFVGLFVSLWQKAKEIRRQMVGKQEKT